MFYIKFVYVEFSLNIHTQRLMKMFKDLVQLLLSKVHSLYKLIMAVDIKPNV